MGVIVGQWELRVGLDVQGHEPLFQQIAQAIVGDIRRGRLSPGDRLPGSRKLARSLSFHRNTVLAAYDELEAQGWVETLPARGTFVTRDLPLVTPKPFKGQPTLAAAGYPTRTGFDHKVIEPPPLSPRPAPGVLAMSGGMPDLRLVPTEELARAYRRALRQGGGPLMGYADPQGHPRLRAALAEMLTATRGLPAGADNVLVTRGSQMGLYLVAQALTGPGDAVAIEGFGYPPAWTALRSAGAELIPIPVDDQGLDVDALADVVARRPVRAVYVTPHHQYPTMAVLSAARRLALLDLARRARFAIIEDDYDNEFHYEGRPVLPLASADTSGAVIYIGTLSKVLAPGLRIGYAVAPQPFVRAMSALRTLIDRQGDQAMEAAVAELIEDDVVQRHIRRVRRIYKARRDFLAIALREHLGEVLSFELPAGGMSLLARVHPPIDVEGWSRRAEASGVLFIAARRYHFHQLPMPFGRFGFASLTEAELQRAVERLVASL